MIAAPAWAYSSANVTGADRCEANPAPPRPHAASAKACPTACGSENVGCAVNTAANRVRSTDARYSAQRTGLSSGSGRNTNCARRSNAAAEAAGSTPPT